MKKHNIVGIDVFCGAGGLTFGLSSSGINIITGVDIDGTVEKTYLANNPGVNFLKEDIKKIRSSDLIKDINREKNYFLLAGCAPCQPFSVQNRERKNDSRKSLMAYFTKLVIKLLPDYIVVENVSGFTNSNNSYHKFLVRSLTKNGYWYDEGILNAADFGVPQNRYRYVLIASRNGPINLPKPKYGHNLKPYKTVLEVIRKYPPLRAGTYSELLPNHKARMLSSINLRRIRLVPKDGGSRSALPKNLELTCHKNHSGHSDAYGRMAWQKPAPTLTCRCTSFTNGRFGHPTQNRAISLREAAALQSFPDSYIFYGNDTDVARHIGNAVPVALAKCLGTTILEHSKKQT